MQTSKHCPLSYLFLFPNHHATKSLTSFITWASTNRTHTQLLCFSSTNCPATTTTIQFYYSTTATTTIITLTVATTTSATLHQLPGKLRTKFIYSMKMPTYLMQSRFCRLTNIAFDYKHYHPFSSLLRWITRWQQRHFKQLSSFISMSPK